MAEANVESLVRNLLGSKVEQHIIDAVLQVFYKGQESYPEVLKEAAEGHWREVADVIVSVAKVFPEQAVDWIRCAVGRCHEDFGLGANYVLGVTLGVFQSVRALSAQDRYASHLWEKELPADITFLILLVRITNHLLDPFRKDLHEAIRGYMNSGSKKDRIKEAIAVVQRVRWHLWTCKQEEGVPRDLMSLGQTILEELVEQLCQAQSFEERLASVAQEPIRMVTSYDEAVNMREIVFVRAATQEEADQAFRIIQPEIYERMYGRGPVSSSILDLELGRVVYIV